MNASPLFFVRQGIESVYQAAKQRLRRCTKPDNHDPVPNAAIDLKRAALLLAVRSSATAEDLLEASFAGQ